MTLTIPQNYIPETRASYIPDIPLPDAAAQEKMAVYIRNKWADLTRKHQGLFLGMLADEKVSLRQGQHPSLYVSQQEDYKAVKTYLDALREDVLRSVENGEYPSTVAAQVNNIELRVLPDDPKTIEKDLHGLLYLPYPYVVPGGRFNETYGWDSAFIVRGLVLDGQFDVAKNMVDNKLYSILHYGTILNANRSYYLGRSQAPFLTNKVLDIYRNYHKLSAPNMSALEWLKSTLPGINSYYAFWTSAPYLHEESGLSYYNDMNETPAPEVVYSEAGHYEHALEQLRGVYHDKLARESSGREEPATYQERKDAYYLSLFYAPAEGDKPDSLTPAFYRGDRAMRSSGFDPSRRFGFFNVDIINHLPVCLNNLLYVMEMETAEIYETLSAHEPQGKDEEGASWREVAKRWTERAEIRKERINQWLWDDASEQIDVAAKFPSYRDYNFQTALCTEYDIPKHRNYVFATAFYPLWTGVASTEQAAEVVKHVYPRLITSNGLMTSPRYTGSQWDAPFAWAPLQVLAVRGLIRYGYIKEALAIAKGFLNTVERGFAETGKIFEKYDMSDGSHNTSSKIDKGYSVNVEGFGWTNSAVLELQAALRQYKSHA